MTDEEEQLRCQLLKGEAIPELPLVDKMIVATVRQASIQTAGRDLLVLGISSFFACLLMLCAPMMAASVARKKRQTIGNMDIHN
ncbi:MAG: hypothetical protein QNK31_09710 [Porticoccus sp.]|nr:hypothetical protein [Porticoccus sp.]